MSKVFDNEEEAREAYEKLFEGIYDNYSPERIRELYPPLREYIEVENKKIIKSKRFRRFLEASDYEVPDGCNNYTVGRFLSALGKMQVLDKGRSRGKGITWECVCDSEDLEYVSEVIEGQEGST